MTDAREVAVGLQIWSNPPDTQPGQDPGIVVNSFGKGKSIWVVTPLGSRDDAVSARILGLLLKRVLQPPYKFEADTDRAVEVTLFHQEDRHRLLVGMLNLQAQVPARPVTAMMRIQVPAGYRVLSVSLQPEQKKLAFSPAGASISFTVPSFKLVCMVSVDYA